MYTLKTFFQSAILRNSEALGEASRTRTLGDVAKLNAGDAGKLNPAVAVPADQFESTLPATVSGGPDSLFPYSEASIENRKFVTGTPDAAEIQSVTGKPDATSPFRIAASLSSADAHGIAQSMVQNVLEEGARLHNEAGETALAQPVGVLYIATGSGHNAEETMSSFDFLSNGKNAGYTFQYNDEASVSSLAEAAHLGKEQIRKMVEQWEEAAPGQKKFVAAESLANAAFYDAYKGHLLDLGNPDSDLPVHLDGGVFMGVPGFVNKHMFKELFQTSMPKGGAISKDGNWALVDGGADPKEWNTSSIVNGKEIKARFIICNNMATDPVPRMGNLRAMFSLALHKPPRWPADLPYHRLRTALHALVGISAATHVKAGQGTGTQTPSGLGNVGHDYSLRKSAVVRQALEAQGIDVSDQVMTKTLDHQSKREISMQDAPPPKK